MHLQRPEQTKVDLCFGQILPEIMFMARKHVQSFEKVN